MKLIIIFILWIALLYFKRPTDATQKLALFLRKLFWGKTIIAGESLVYRLNTSKTYKHFTDVYEQIVSLQRTMTGVDEELNHLFFHFVNEDLTWEKRGRKVIVDALGQMMVITATIWGFFLFLAEELSVNLSGRWEPLAIGFCHIFAPLILILLAPKLTKVIEAKFGELCAEYLKIMFLKEGGLSVSQIISKAKITQSHRSIELNMLSKRLSLITQHWRKTGEDPSPQLNLLKAEINRVQESILSTKKKKIELLKFSLLGVFHLGSYLLVISTIIPQTFIE